MLSKLAKLFSMSAEKNEEYIPFEIRLAGALRDHRIEAESNGGLNPLEASAMLRAEDGLQKNSLAILGWPTEAESALRSLWDDGVTLEEFLRRKAESLRQAYDAGIRFSLMSPRWSLIFSDDFAKAISSLDKKTQGRILEALARITEAPITMVGDTVKPLTGNAKGIWRYRIGDYRLLYDPNLSDRHITLLSFGPRGDVYGDL